MVLGGSTAYGIYSTDQDTSSAHLAARLRTSLPDETVEVINAGVPGWTSMETRRRLPRIVAFDPDVIVVLDGRNDALAQLFNDFRDDYSHYRRIRPELVYSNYWPKLLFRWSHAYMAVATRRGGLLGFSALDENPAYATIRYDNQPGPEDIATNARDSRRAEAFRRNLAAVTDHVAHVGIGVVLVTMPFLEARYRSGVIPGDARTLPHVTARVLANNALIREVAESHRVSVVHGYGLTRPDLLHDDCHFNSKGEQALAGLLADAIVPILRAFREPDRRTPAS
jgi:lysophospholipase L1-like esterase